MSSDRWMDKEDAKYTYNGMPFSLKKKLTSPVMTAWINLEDLLLRWNKPDTEGQILHVLYMRNLKWSKSKKQTVEWWLPGAMGGWMRRNCRLKKHSQPMHETGCSGLVHWWPWGMGWRGRWEGDSGWGICVHLWLIHVNVWQKPLQYYKVISLQLK